MPTINPTLPNDGENADAADVNVPLLAILALINGLLDDSNIASLSGTKLNAGTVPETAMDSASKKGWHSLSVQPTVSSGYNKGQKEFDLTFANIDLSGVLSPGMRLKVNRGTTPPTQCADFEASSSQYANKTTPSGITFTDDFTMEAWVKLESYAIGQIGGRQDATVSNGFNLAVIATGQVRITGYSGGVARFGTSTQSLPLGRWVHVAASLDMSANSAVIYIDGVSVPLAMTGAATALTQASDLAIGRGGAYATEYFDGKVMDFRIWNVVRTSTQILDNMNQQLVGSESNLVAYFKLNGDFNDSTSNANNLTAQAGVLATSADNPMNTTEYAIVTKVTYGAPNTTVTVFTGTDYNIPNMLLNTAYYSTGGTPFGFPSAEGKWIVEARLFNASVSRSAPTSATWYSASSVGDSFQLRVPTGKWKLSYQSLLWITRAAAGTVWGFLTLSSSSTTESHPELREHVYDTNAIEIMQPMGRNTPIDQDSAGLWYLLFQANGASHTSIVIYSGQSISTIRAVCAYL